MLSGKLAKAERGELAVPLPIGYVRRPSGEVILDPDEQARHVVRLVFTAFARLGTLNGVLRYLVDQQVQLPVRVHSGPAKGEIEWRRPNRETLQVMLHNPVYAGYYAYGRRQVEPRRKVPGLPGTGRVVKDASEWLERTWKSAQPSSSLKSVTHCRTIPVGFRRGGAACPRPTARACTHRSQPRTARWR